MGASLAERVPPDLGPVRYVRDDSLPGGWAVNMAGVVEMARTGQTRQSVAFYEAFCIAYERVADLPMTSAAKQRLAFNEAMAAAGLGSGVEIATIETNDGGARP